MFNLIQCQKGQKSGPFDSQNGLKKINVEKSIKKVKSQITAAPNSCHAIPNIIFIIRSIVIYDDLKNPIFGHRISTKFTDFAFLIRSSF